MLSHSIMSDSLWPHTLQPDRLICSCNFPGKNSRMGYLFLLQGICLTQGSNPQSLAPPALAGFLNSRATWKASLFFFLILFYLTLKYCIGFAIYQNESATGIHVFPILNPPPSSPFTCSITAGPEAASSGQGGEPQNTLPFSEAPSLPLAQPFSKKHWDP